MKPLSILQRSLVWSQVLGLGLTLGIGLPDSRAGESPEAAPVPNPEARSLEARASELEKLGQGDEAAQLRTQAREVRDAREVAELETQVGRLQRALNPMPGRAPEARSPRPEGMGRGPASGMNRSGRPQEHLRMAVEQLHAAGLHQMAERVAQEGTRQMGGHRGEPGMAVRGEMEQLRAAVRELRAAVEELRQRGESGPRRRF